jgi:hypothetical protein
MLNNQTAPYPQSLAIMIEQVRYKPGFRFELNNIDRGQDSKGLTLSIYITTNDAYHSDRDRSVVHYFPVPPAAYDERSWQRWLFDRILDVETHEAMEFFRFPPEQVGDKEIHPYAPSHGPGNDPYMIREVGTELDTRTAFTGKVN